MTPKMAQEMTKNEVILELLREQGALSTHQIAERCNELGVRFNGNGQVLTRLRLLKRRSPPAVIEEDGPRGRLWRLS